MATGKINVSVAVVTNNLERYRDYVNTLSNSGDTFVFIDSIDAVRGHRFHKVVKLYGYQNIKNLDDILEYIEIRLIVKPTKLGFWYWFNLVVITPFWFFYRSKSKKTWSEFKSGLIKHEHQWDYKNPVYEKGHKHYPCKHLGCNYISIYEKDGSLCK